MPHNLFILRLTQSLLLLLLLLLLLSLLLLLLRVGDLRLTQLLLSADPGDLNSLYYS